MPTLIQISYSPWSEKARWALDHHRIAYQRKEHHPILGEVSLRYYLRQATGQATVPALIDNKNVYKNSWEIAHYAEQMGSGKSLFPEEHQQAISEWNNISETALRAARIQVFSRIASLPRAQEDNLEGVVPLALRPYTRFVTRIAIKLLAQKYQAAHVDAATLINILDRLRRTLDQQGESILGTPTYADIAMAVVFQFIDPVADDFLPIAPGIREGFYDPTLAREYRDLVNWRDRIYAERRLGTPLNTIPI